MTSTHLKMLQPMLLATLLVMALACGEDEGECVPEADEGCVCVLDAEDVTVGQCVDNETPQGEPCSCSTGRSKGPVCGDDVCEEGETPETCSDCAAPAQTSNTRHVLVRDLTLIASGEHPGFDLDAIGLIKSDGTEFFATYILDTSEVDCLNNEASCDFYALMGAPDAVCVDGGVNPTLFTSLNRGFVVVGFDGQIVENGDTIRVYTPGSDGCLPHEEDFYSVSVGTPNQAFGSYLEMEMEEEDVFPVEGIP